MLAARKLIVNSLVDIMPNKSFVFLASSRFASNTVATWFYFAYICQLLTNV